MKPIEARTQQLEQMAQAPRRGDDGEDGGQQPLPPHLRRLFRDVPPAGRETLPPHLRALLDG